jgi:hypothetical protein
VRVSSSRLVLVVESSLLVPVRSSVWFPGWETPEFGDTRPWLVSSVAPSLFAHATPTRSRAAATPVMTPITFLCKINLLGDS